MRRKSVGFLLLAALLCLSPLFSAKAYAGRGNIMPDGEEYLPFIDVDKDSWYGFYVQCAYNEGIINGRTKTTFAPNGYVTMGEVATMAAKLHIALMEQPFRFQKKYEGPWYEQYVRYYFENNIYKNKMIDAGKAELYSCENWNAPAKRSDVAGMFAHVDQRPGRGFLNPDVPLTDIPDVDRSTPHHQEILTMYRMGVAVGDEWMRFNPDRKIRRSEAVALAVRLLFDDARVELPKG